MIAYPWRTSLVSARRMWNVAGGSGNMAWTSSCSEGMAYYNHRGYSVNAYSETHPCPIDATNRQVAVSRATQNQREQSLVEPECCRWIDADGSPGWNPRSEERRVGKECRSR